MNEFSLLFFTFPVAHKHYAKFKNSIATDLSPTAPDYLTRVRCNEVNTHPQIKKQFETT